MLGVTLYKNDHVRVWGGGGGDKEVTLHKKKFMSG